MVAHLTINVLPPQTLVALSIKVHLYHFGSTFTPYFFLYNIDFLFIYYLYKKVVLSVTSVTTPHKRCRINVYRGSRYVLPVAHLTTFFRIFLQNDHVFYDFRDQKWSKT